MNYQRTLCIKVILLLLLFSNFSALSATDDSAKKAQSLDNRQKDSKIHDSFLRKRETTKKKNNVKKHQTGFKSLSEGQGARPEPVGMLLEDPLGGTGTMLEFIGLDEKPTLETQIVIRDAVQESKEMLQEFLDSTNEVTPVSVHPNGIAVGNNYQDAVFNVAYGLHYENPPGAEKREAVLRTRTAVSSTLSGLQAPTFRFFEFDRTTALGAAAETRVPAWGGGYGESFWRDFFGFGRTGLLGGTLELHIPFHMTKAETVHFIIHEATHKFANTRDNVSPGDDGTAYPCEDACDSVSKSWGAIMDIRAKFPNPEDEKLRNALLKNWEDQLTGIYDFRSAVPLNDGPMNADSVTCAVTHGKGVCSRYE